MMTRKLLTILAVSASLVLLQACNSEEKTQKEDKVEKVEEAKGQTDEKKAKTDSKYIPNEEINTDVYAYATNVYVTDKSGGNREHIEVEVHMSPNAEPGLAAQHVFAQTFDFAKKDDMDATKMITVGIVQGEARIAQITVDKSKLQLNEGDLVLQSVLKASTIDMMSDDVKEYGKENEIW